MDKLLIIINIVQNIYGRLVVRRIISGTIVITGLTIISSIMISAMLIGGFYATYLALLQSGSDPLKAALTVCSLGLITTILLVTLAISGLKRMFGVSQKLQNKKSEAIAHVNDAVDSFLEGFLQKPPAQ